MRDVFHGELALLHDQLASLSARATEEMRQASEALAAADLALAEQVIRADSTMKAEREICEEHAQSLLALQAPVATDLRAILATLYCVVKIDRMGDLAVHIAEIVRFSHPERPVPPELRDTFTTLGELTVGMAEYLYALIVGAAGDGFAKMDAADDEVDAICARILRTVTRADWAYGVQSATNLALLVRFYERFADQAVSVARRLEFATTGTLPGSVW